MALKVLNRQCRVVRLLESDQDTGRHKFLVVLITEGKGNAKDRYYYSQKCIEDPTSSAAFEGKPCMFNHQDAIEEKTQPEGKVERICGYFSSVHAVGNGIQAELTTTTNTAGVEASKILMDALNHAQEHPGMSLVGFSVNADGDISGETTDADGVWKIVDRIPNADSCDLVTKPARGGKVLKLLESDQEVQLSDVLNQMREALEVGGDFPLKNTLRKMCESALTLANTGKEGEGKMFPPTSPAVPAVKPPVPGTPATPASQAEGEAEAKSMRQAAFKHMAERHQAEGNADMAAKYTKMAEAEGDLTITHSGAPPVAPPPAAQSEDEAKRQAEARQSENESQKKMTESVKTLRTQVAQYRLRESGLPEVFHAGILREAATLDDASLNARITEEVQKHTYILQESMKSGVTPRLGTPGAGAGNSAMDAALASRGL